MNHRMMSAIIKCPIVREKMTIRDIAKESGVSIATVSRVINNSGMVSDAARRSVEAAITKFDYQKPEAKNENKSRHDWVFNGIIWKQQKCLSATNRASLPAARRFERGKGRANIFGQEL